MHRLVDEYLERFDAAAAATRLPDGRRVGLRQEIVDNLSAAIPESATDAAADQVLAGFGTPAEILEQERDSADAEPVGSPQSRARVLTTGAVVIVVIALLLAAVLPLALAFAR
ncbi:MAG TPA: hypothetical protein VNT53_11400 [Pseudolysinimonas sp.]|nr:hypothetical protein [Pseudolysinimonas sp.]